MLLQENTGMSGAFTAPMRKKCCKLACMQGAAGAVVHYCREDSEPRTKQTWERSLHSAQFSASEIREGEEQQQLLLQRLSNDAAISHIPEDDSSCVDGEWIEALPQHEASDWCGEEGLVMIPDLDSIHMSDGMQRQATTSVECADECVTGKSATGLPQQRSGQPAISEEPRAGKP